MSVSDLQEPLVVHEAHTVPTPVPAKMAEGTPISAPPAPPPVGQARDVEVLTEKNVSSEMVGVTTNHPPGDDGPPLVEGVSNRDLYAMLRSFNSQVNRVIAPAIDIPRHQPDLRQAALSNIAYRSDTLKSNFERVVAAVGPSSMRGLREVQRLGDWDREIVRTATYCTAYFISWYAGLAVLASCMFFAVLICFPSTRRHLFPAMPRRQDESLITSNARRTRAEQAEEQAFEARAVLEAYTQAVVLGGMRAPSDPNVLYDADGNVIGAHVDEGAVEVENVDGDGVGKVAHSDGGVVSKPGQEKKATEQAAKKKRDQMIAKMAKGTEIGLGSAADYMEILQNALSPPVPYPDTNARFKLAMVVLVPGVLLTVCPARLLGRIASFAFGLGLWGRPLVLRAVRLFQRKTNWKVVLDPRNSLLSGTPTNAQLTLHLLRVSEDLGSPLPPPPDNTDNVKKALQDTSPVNQSGNEKRAELKEIENDSGSKVEEGVQKSAVKGRHHIGNAFKKISKKLAVLRGDVVVDGGHKQIGSKLENKMIEKKFGENSPDAYGCKDNGKGGHLIIDEDSGRIGWVAVGATAATYVWDIASIVELRKDAVAVPRLALGWIGGAAVQSLGLTIRFGDEDDGHHFQSVERREQLFNRLVALGPQRWAIL